MLELFTHQKEGIVFLKEKGKAILADEMGLGKTRQAIVAGAESVVYPLRTYGGDPMDHQSALIVCPASLKINWKREILAVFPNTKIYVVESGKERPIEKANWIIINYDMLSKYKEQLKEMVESQEIGLAILDEAHYIKGKKSLRSKVTLEIIEELRNVYVLTGTPIMNRPIELFNLLVAIKHPLARTKSFYSKRYCGGHMKVIPRRNKPPIRFWDETGATRLEELREMTKNHILRRKKEDVLDLPEKMISVQLCELDKEWQKTYDTAWDNYVEYLSNNPDGRNVENILNAQHLVELMKLKQVCSQAKIDRMVEDIRNTVEQGEKVIVFSQFTYTIHEIARQLREGEKGVDPVKTVTLTGQDDMDARQKSVDAFVNDPDTKVFVLNIKAGGVGLNLTTASIVMFADMEWSPEIHAQAEDRAHRIGQKGTVNVYYYVLVDTIEEDIVDILEGKRSVIKKIMDGGTDMITENSMAAEFLERLKAKLGTSN